MQLSSYQRSAVRDKAPSLLACSLCRMRRCKAKCNSMLIMIFTVTEDASASEENKVKEEKENKNGKKQEGSSLKDEDKIKGE